MDGTKLIQYIDRYDIIYLVITNLEENVIREYGEKDKLLYDGLIKTNFYDINTIHELNNNLEGEGLPKVFKQGEVVCVIGKPNDKNIIGIFYHEHRKAEEFIKWTKYIYNCLLEIWS